MARIELLDALQVQACNRYSKLSLPETPMLFLEFHGTEAGVAEQSQRFGEIARGIRRRPVRLGDQAEDRTRLWQARHDAYWAQRGLRPNAQPLATDVCVPISRLADCVTETQRDIAESKLARADRRPCRRRQFPRRRCWSTSTTATRSTRAEAFLERLVERALAMDGTCTGEHGVGQGKMKYLRAEHGEAALAVMRAIKRALDPQDIMNPGKVINL